VAGGHSAFETKHPVASFEVKIPTLVIWGENCDPYLLIGNLIGASIRAEIDLERICLCDCTGGARESGGRERADRDFLETGSK